MKAVIKASLVIIGTVIGAGFASGQEIYLFFGKFGMVGSISLLLSCSLTGIIIYKTMQLAKEENITTYSEFLQTLLQGNKRHQLLTSSIHLVITLFLGISFIVMVAGFGAYFSQELGLPKIIGCIIVCILGFLVMQKNINGMIKVNEIGIPILIVLIVLLGMICHNQSTVQIATEHKVSTSMLYGILYASYNSIVLIPILIDMQPLLKRKKAIAIVAILCTILLLVLGGTIFHLIQTIEGVKQIEIPLLQVAWKAGKGFAYCYGIAILVAIFTSAISAGYGFMQNISQDKKTQTRSFIILSILAVFIGNVGFSHLVQLLYPIFGYLGILQIFFLLEK